MCATPFSPFSHPNSEKVQSFMPGVVVISMDMYNDGSKVFKHIEWKMLRPTLQDVYDVRRMWARGRG